MKLDRAIELAKNFELQLAWDINFKVYMLTGTGVDPLGIRASWLAIIDEQEFIDNLSFARES